MEVLEHIPAQYETVVLDNIDRAARHGVVLSWAVVGQGGFRHVNNRSPVYVKKTMFDRGFRLYQAASDDLSKRASVSWLKNNIKVYIRM